MDNPDAFENFISKYEEYRTGGDEDVVPDFYRQKKISNLKIATTMQILGCLMQKEKDIDNIVMDADKDFLFNNTNERGDHMGLSVNDDGDITYTYCSNDKKDKKLKVYYVSDFSIYDWDKVVDLILE